MGWGMAYLFLSYSKLDKKSAESISSLLQKEGCAVWMDENPRELTQEQWPVIEENIRNAAAFILLVSEGAKQSAWLRRELDFAESIQKTIIPILIEGKGWSRLEMPLETLELGLNLDFSDSLRLKLNQLELTPLPTDLPPQIPAHTIDYKRGRAKKSFLLWLGIMAAMIVLVLIIVPAITGGINAQATANSLLQVENTAVSQTLFYEGLTATRESRAIAATQTREGLFLYRTEERATNLAVQQESRQTRTQEHLNTRATGTSISATRQAVAAQQRIMNNTQVFATVTQQYILNETAIAGSGHLPCHAFVLLEDETSEILVYRSPNLSLNPFRITRRENQEFLVVEWLANEDGYWYRIGTEARYSIGYVRPEALELDETCPR
jgi:hypothetical protein